MEAQNIAKIGIVSISLYTCLRLVKTMIDYIDEKINVPIEEKKIILEEKKIILEEKKIILEEKKLILEEKKLNLTYEQKVRLNEEEYKHLLKMQKIKKQLL